MNYPYSIKARILINCHLVRTDRLSSLLMDDLDYILLKSSKLVQEMVNCISQLTIMANYQKAQKPRLDTLENVMKLAPMFVQALRETKSPLLQLPYFNDDYVKYCHTNKKSACKNLRALASLHESDRRQMLRRMGDEAYETMLCVLGNFPDVELDARLHVIDDEKTNVITAGAIVTVSLTMTRRSLKELQPVEAEVVVAPVVEEVEEDVEEEEKAAAALAAQQPKLKPWEKQTKKKKKKKPAKGAAGKKAAALKLKAAAAAAEKIKVEELGAGGDSTLAKEATEGSADENSDEDVAAAEAEEAAAAAAAAAEEAAKNDSKKAEDAAREEREWQEMQASFKKKEKAAFEAIDKRTHTVYAENYPVEKHEWWWVYIADRKNHALLTAPVIICNLRDTQEVELKFPAPGKTGKYTYTIWCRSDSYLDCDRYHDIKLDVKEAPPVDEDHPQWHMSDEEDDDEASSSDGEGISSDEDDEAALE